METHEGTPILLVDDEADLLEVLAMSLSHSGYAPFTASSGEEALEAVRDRRFAVVVTDIRMPGMGGGALLDSLKSTDAANPAVILITAFEDIGVEEAHDRGAEALVLKPFDLAELCAAIERSILPPTERWSQPLHQGPLSHIDLRYESLMAASRDKVLGVGRGGFYFLLSEEKLLPGAVVEFSLSMETGPLERLSGTGILRWMARASADDAPVASGVEFEYLDPPSRECFARWVEAQQPTAFIPSPRART